jgi:serine/threonine-protein kinase RsbW
VHEALRRLRAEVREDDEDFGLFELAVGEIVANVAAHARPVGSDGVHVTMELRADSRVFEAVVVDDGAFASLDLDSLRMPDADAESGRGLAMARAALDDLQHRAALAPASGNRWELTRRRR